MITAGGTVLFEPTLHLARDDEFFIGRDNQNLHTRVGRADDGFFGPGGAVLRRVKSDPELIESRADRLTERGPVFAGARCEHERVRAGEFQIKRANPAPRLLRQHVQSHLRARAPPVCLGLDVADVVEAAG